MSIDGELVIVNVSPGSYVPVFTKRASTSLTFDAQMNFPMGAPRSFA